MTMKTLIIPSELQPMANLTLHPQGPREIAIAAGQGFALDPDPHGIEISVSDEALRMAAKKLAEILIDCAARRWAVLAGGHTGLWISAVSRIAGRCTASPEIYVFETARVRDGAGHFVFVPIRLMHVPYTEPRDVIYSPTVH